MVALPLPEALPALTVSHAAFDVAVHAQFEADAVSATLPDPAVAGTLWVDAARL
jgi:hypothetical protein